MTTTAPGSFFCAMAVLIAAETAEKSGVEGSEVEMVGAVVASLAGSVSFDCASQGRDAPLKMTISRRSAVVADGVRADCLRKTRLASEPTAKVTNAPMMTYQVQAT